MSNSRTANLLAGKSLALVRSYVSWITFVLMFIFWAALLRSFYDQGSLQYGDLSAIWYGMFVAGGINGGLVATSSVSLAKRSAVGKAFTISMLTAFCLLVVAVPWLAIYESIPLDFATALLNQHPEAALAYSAQWVSSVRADPNLFGSMLILVLLWMNARIGQRLGLLAFGGNLASAFVAALALLVGVVFALAFVEIANSSGSNLVRLMFQLVLVVLVLGTISGLIAQFALGAGSDVLNLSVATSLVTLYLDAPVLNLLSWSWVITEPEARLGLGGAALLITLAAVNRVSKRILSGIMRILSARRIYKGQPWLGQLQSVTVEPSPVEEPPSPPPTEEAMPSRVVCAQCGTKNPAGVLFCKSCGTRLVT